MIEHEPKPESDLESDPEPEVPVLTMEREEIDTAGSEIVRLRRHFDQGSARQLGELLRAVAAFAVGGIVALERQGSDAAKLLLGQARKISVLR